MSYMHVQVLRRKRFYGKGFIEYFWFPEWDLIKGGLNRGRRLDRRDTDACINSLGTMEVRKK